jgi:hypothetical protein
MSDVTTITASRPGTARRAATAKPGRRAGRPSAYGGDVVIYRMVVLILGLVTIAATIGALFCEIGALFCEMSAGKHEIPQFLTALGSGALGALAGLLAPSPMSSGK